MDFDAPAGRNPIDNERIVTKSVDRIDGPLKVSGTASYSYEYHAEAPGAAYGFVVGAGIAKGRIASIDTSAAEAAPGVLLVLTHRNMPKQGKKAGQSSPQLTGPEVAFYEQAVAFVVAKTFEAARSAAKLIQIEYEAAEGTFDLAAEKSHAKPPPEGGWVVADTAVGDFEGGFAKAPVKLDVTYTTPNQSHAMMEPHASTALWDGDALILYTAHQMLHWAKDGVAKTLKLRPENVRVVSRYVGGGFGSKLQLYADAILSAVAARKLGRPVKTALTRPQIFNHTTHRPATIQRIRIGAGADGRIAAIGHECWSGNQPGGGIENGASQTRLLYAGKDRMTQHRLATLDLPVGFAMRAPGEAVGLLALECAMDELAETLAIDPVELRILNDVQYDPETGPSKPFSTRNLVGCLREGAKRFGWEKRNPKPGQVRDGRQLIGVGVASAIRDNLTMDSGARVILDGKGRLTVETQMTDIGTGSYTIIAQVAAEMMGLEIDDVTVKLGDTDFPESSGSGGSWGANSSTAGVFAACDKLRGAIAQRAGFNAADVTFQDGQVTAGNRSRTLAEVAGAEGISAEGGIKFGKFSSTFAQAGFGAHFAEVSVDMDTCEVRVRRMLSVVAAGRIINPKMARNQCLGGMTMGIGAALMEEQIVDLRHGYFVNHDLAEYQVPVHADIPDIDAIFLEELDDKSSPIKAKGVGELGICGVGASVANAIYNACGVRVRDYPITLDKILAGLPAEADLPA